MGFAVPGVASLVQKKGGVANEVEAGGVVSHWSVPLNQGRVMKHSGAVTRTPDN